MEPKAIHWSSEDGRQRWQPAIVDDDGITTYLWRTTRPGGRRTEKWAIAETKAAHPALHDSPHLALVIARSEIAMIPLRQKHVAAVSLFSVLAHLERLL